MILDNYQEFLDKLLSNIKEKGIDVSGYYLDHFGYQCSSDEDYDKLKPELMNIAKMVSEKYSWRKKSWHFSGATQVKFHLQPVLEIVGNK